MTMFYTILTGVLIFVLGRIIEKMIIDPIKEYWAIVAEIYDGMIFYANRTSNPIAIDKATPDEIKKHINQVSDDIRRLSTKLRIATYNMRWFYKFHSLFGAPKLKDINEVCGALIGLSNSLTYVKDFEPIERNIKYQKLIFEKLKLTKFENKLKQ
ncbi:hypothetical protein [Bacillus sp. AFS002410]|uniref:hypothetical protein n=1 Tax=Bacillus sp. AFS002410 TaxID=2033481 RepID=UPI001155916D|nr:hypothetical protein [Bacillus sp. AFS002410]